MRFSALWPALRVPLSDDVEVRTAARSIRAQPRAERFSREVLTQIVDDAANAGAGVVKKYFNFTIDFSSVQTGSIDDRDEWRAAMVVSIAEPV